MKKKKKLTPYTNWTKKELQYSLKVHVSRLDINHELKDLWKDLIDEAFQSEFWNVIYDFNGCTLVQDMFHPCPACFVHDYMWISGHGGYISDRIFFNLMISEGMSKSKATRRWFAVRVGWYFSFMWKYILQKKYMNPTEKMIKIDQYFK